MQTKQIRLGIFILPPPSSSLNVTKLPDILVQFSDKITYFLPTVKSQNNFRIHKLHRQVIGLGQMGNVGPISTIFTKGCAYLRGLG